MQLNRLPIGLERISLAIDGRMFRANFFEALFAALKAMETISAEDLNPTDSSHLIVLPAVPSILSLVRRAEGNTLRKLQHCRVRSQP